MEHGGECDKEKEHRRHCLYEPGGIPNNNMNNTPSSLHLISLCACGGSPTPTTSSDDGKTRNRFFRDYYATR